MIRYSVKGKKGRKVAAFLGVTALSVALLAMPVMAKGTGTVTGTGVNVRKSAGTAAEKVTTVTTGDQLRVTGRIAALSSSSLITPFSSTPT